MHTEIDKRFNELKKAKYLKGFSDNMAARLRRKFKALIQEIQRNVFQKLPLSPADRAKLNIISGWLLVRDHFLSKGTSGVVIAGFGERDIYPRLSEFAVAGLIENRLRFQLRNEVRIDAKTIASIIPFAQSEVVRSFIDGMDPGLEGLLNKFLDGVFTNYPSVLLSQMPDLIGSKKLEVAKKTGDASKEILKTFRQEFNKFRRETLVTPIVSTVGVLPKDELAAMAESLVSLTSFKRKFSFDAETVGGPVDVAVLSKGDGLIWIKRKHYFKPELNPHFLKNYFIEE